MLPNKHYDYIFAGSGLAAHMMLFFMSDNDFFKEKSILMIDASAKSANDRTWCFWEKKDGIFDDILYHSWAESGFLDNLGKVSLALYPYRYKMIRSANFYNFIKSKTTNLKITWMQDEVVEITENEAAAIVNTKTNSFSANQIFSSLFNPGRALTSKKYPYIQQHFIGFFVVTDKAVFNPNQPTFMDFSIPQKGNTRFMYVLPVSSKKALVEYTLFSKDLLHEDEYEQAIDDYLKALGTTYTIVEKEKGTIPMTCYRFSEHQTNKIIPIGSAGGWTKASTGYTFKHTMKHARNLSVLLTKNNQLNKFPPKNRFWFYDLLLLDILYKTNEKGSLIFSSMFRNSRPYLIFKFLDEETSIFEDIKVIWSCPKKLFIGALVSRLFKF
jgi:lycopene beta-cyclase